MRSVQLQSNVVEKKRYRQRNIIVLKFKNMSTAMQTLSLLLIDTQILTDAAIRQR